MKDIETCGGHSWPMGIPRCSECNKAVRTVYRSAEWHKVHDPLEGYCNCSDNKFKTLVEAVVAHKTKEDVETIESLRTQLSELQAAAAKALLDADFEYNKKTNIIIKQHFEQLTAMQLYAKGLKNESQQFLDMLFRWVSKRLYDQDCLTELCKQWDKALNSAPPYFSAVGELVKDAERYRFRNVNIGMCGSGPANKVCQYRNNMIAEAEVDAAMLTAHKNEGGE